jgi:transposase-like protein
MVVASPGNLCKINLNKRQRLRHFLNHKGIRSRFKCTSQSCAYVRSASYQSTRTAARTLYGIETMHAIHKESRKKLGLFGFSAFQEVDQLLAA